jgi:hypothetical protein
MTRRQTRARAFAPDPDVPGNAICQHAGCGEAALYRAPRSRSNLRDYLWFCLEHVRDYNKRWDYFAGLDATEMGVLAYPEFVGSNVGGGSTLHGSGA